MLKAEASAIDTLRARLSGPIGTRDVHWWITAKNRDAFWERVPPESARSEDECWEWTGTISKSGYGCFSVGREGRRRTMGAHRYSLALHRGPFDPDLHVLHACDNPPCVNPAHLSAGTPSQNNRETIERGRKRVNRGEGHWAAKLSEEDVVLIRAFCEAGVMKTEIARIFGVSGKLIGAVEKRLVWKHVR